MLNIPTPLAIGILAVITGMWVLIVAGNNADEELAEKGAVITVASSLWCGYYQVFSV